MNVRLAPFYQDYTFRRMKMLSFIGRQRTEAKMIREFKEKFGSGEEVVVAIGDWEQRQHRKFKEPTKGKGSERSCVNQAMTCIWSTSFVPAADVASVRSMVSVRCFWSVRTRDRTVQDASCVMGLSGVRPTNVYGTGIRTSLNSHIIFASVRCLPMKDNIFMRRKV